MKKCKRCKKQKLITFLASYENKKVFQSDCENCNESYIFFLIRNKHGQINYMRTYD